MLIPLFPCVCVAGISGKTQCLFALVFTTRYLDLVTNFVSPYNTVMKIVFLASAYATVYLVLMKFRATYDSNHDTFRAEFLVIPAVGLALLVNHEFSPMEVHTHRERERQCVFKIVCHKICTHHTVSYNPHPTNSFTSCIHTWTDLVDILHLPGECCDHAPVVHDPPRRERRRLLHHTTCLHWGCTGASTSSTGYIVSTWRTSTTGLPLWLAVYKQLSTATSSISTSLKVSSYCSQVSDQCRPLHTCTWQYTHTCTHSYERKGTEATCLSQRSMAVY